MEKILFDSWESIIRTLIVTILAYIAIIFILRLTGKRTLSKMNAFDFLITIALGSSLATVALNKSVALADGVLLFFLLVMLQYLITWLSVRIKSLMKMITTTPALLVYKGQIIEETMKEERITIEELYLSARQKGISKIEDVDAIILEPTGILTVIEKLNVTDAETLTTVKIPNLDMYKKNK
jgi:uncharacterized membrane protein YcaP (DUF421 family)